MVLFGNLAKEADALRAALGGQRLVSVIESDGYAALRRTCRRAEPRPVPIDPPYDPTSIRPRARGLEVGHERWPTGMFCIWYPLTDLAARRVSNATSSAPGSAGARRALRILPGGRAGRHGGAGPDRRWTVAAGRTAQGTAAAAAQAAVARGARRQHASRGSCRGSPASSPSLDPPGPTSSRILWSRAG